MKVKPQSLVKCAIYTRHCPAIGEAMWRSHQEQRDACKAFVASQRQQGWRALPTRYIDRDSSRPPLQRASLRRLLEHVQKGMIDVVLVYRVEHLSTNLSELARIIGMLYEHKVSLVSLSQHINTSEPAGRLALSLLLSFVGFESKPNSETQAKAAPATPKPAESEKFLQNSQQTNSGFRHTIQIKFLALGPEREKAFLSWARKGFRFRKPAASQPLPADPAKTA